MAVTNIAENAVATPSNTAKNAASPKRYAKGGSGWKYDQAELTYDGLTDPVTGLSVSYDAMGTTPTITNLAKTAA